MSTSRNPFIVIEAADAGGSQTQTNLLVRRLKRAGRAPLQLHFPQEDRATGRLIYDKFLLLKNAAPSGWPRAVRWRSFTRREQALLYLQDFFARSSDIEAWLEHDIVVSDRFYTSTLAYQTMGLSGRQRDQMLRWLEWLCSAGTPRLPRPDLIIFLDTPVDVSLKRLKKKQTDYFESRAHLTALRTSYLRLVAAQRWRVVPSVDEQGRERTRTDMHEEIWGHVRPLAIRGAARLSKS